jgi:dinuclear metal center YbgI/SA1388 family protein
MKICDLTSHLETIAPLSLQEEYDNAGLLVGDASKECTGALCTLDVDTNVIEEAIKKKCNLIVSHHPLIFRGLKKLSGNTLVEKSIISAIKHDIAIYACHTNLDNVINGVNGKIASILQFKNIEVLDSKSSPLLKLFTFVPAAHIDTVRDALFAAGAGDISKYSECSFTSPGTGTFKPGEGTNPYSGTIGNRQTEEELKLEIILPSYRKSAVLRALFSSHPYEEVAYDLVTLENDHAGTGFGVIGDIDAVGEEAFLTFLATTFKAEGIRHTKLLGKPIKRVAVCGGSGSFLTSKALRAGADAFVTADFKYHDFFGWENAMLVCDIGHYESEQFTSDLFVDLIREKFPTFAVLKSETDTNPVYYFPGNKRK